MRTRWSLAVVGVALVAGVFSVIALSGSDGDTQSSAQPESTATPTVVSSTLTATATRTINWVKPGPEVTPAPNQTPDPRQPWWWVPWENAEKAKPYFEGELAGIRITTSPYEPPFEQCPDFRYVFPEIDYSLELRYNPEAMLRMDGGGLPTATWCGQRLRSAYADFSYAPFTEHSSHGGSIRIARYATDEPVAQVWLRQDQVSAGEVGGHPAVLATPFLDEFTNGPSAVIVWDGEYITKVEAGNVRMAEVLRVAEGLFPPP